jgi:hypothetical protein
VNFHFASPIKSPKNPTLDTENYDTRVLRCVRFAQTPGGEDVASTINTDYLRYLATLYEPSEKMRLFGREGPVVRFEMCEERVRELRAAARAAEGLMKRDIDSKNKKGRNVMSVQEALVG